MQRIYAARMCPERRDDDPGLRINAAITLACFIIALRAFTIALRAFTIALRVFPNGAPAATTDN
ncbi:MAG: hypothetical protein ABI905_08590 [Betaproteobacteria bacterium]